MNRGASNSDIWCQIFADILNIEVLTTESSQAGALGTAATAAAIGLYRDLEDSLKHGKDCTYLLPRRKQRYLSIEI